MSEDLNSLVIKAVLLLLAAVPLWYAVYKLKFVEQSKKFWGLLAELSGMVLTLVGSMWLAWISATTFGQILTNTISELSPGEVFLISLIDFAFLTLILAGVCIKLRDKANADMGIGGSQ